jgi:hypothetical protein
MISALPHTPRTQTRIHLKQLGLARAPEATGLASAGEEVTGLPGHWQAEGKLTQ